MKTILYNTTTKKPEHYFNNGYLVDGKPGRVDAPMIELTVIDSDAPIYDAETQRLTSEQVADLKLKTWSTKFTVTDKTEQEIADEKAAAQAALEASPEYKIGQLEGVIEELITKLNDKEIIP